MEVGGELDMEVGGEKRVMLPGLYLLVLFLVLLDHQTLPHHFLFDAGVPFLPT